MFDAKKLLDQFLGSQMPGTSGSIGQKGTDLVEMAKANPWKTGALAAVLLGTKTGRSLGGGALKLGGLAVIAGLGIRVHARNGKQGAQHPRDGRRLDREIAGGRSGDKGDIGNIGVLARWEAALQVMQAYQQLPAGRRRDSRGHGAGDLLPPRAGPGHPPGDCALDGNLGAAGDSGPLRIH